jgi:hypothetical protein
MCPRALVALAAALALTACGGSPGGGGGDGGPGGDGGAGGDGGGSGGDAGGGSAAVYAHTASALYRVDPDTFQVTEVGPFQWPGASDQMTDLAIDKNGTMIGLSFDAVYQVNPDTATATLRSANLDGNFNGLSFVPADELGQTGDDVLIASRNTDGKIFRIDRQTGQATEIGDMGHGYVSSGDIVSVEGFGTVATVDDGGSSDLLVKLAPVTFDATPIGTGTGVASIWGVGFWKDKVFGFAEDGRFVLIDINTGQASMVSSASQAWWGAAVTTVAPVIVN